MCLHIHGVRATCLHRRATETRMLISHTNRIGMRREEAQKITEETRKTYDIVAGEFSTSRAKFWDELVFLAERMKPDDRVLDIGCGNGRLFPLAKKHAASYVGIDHSTGLIREATRLHPEGKFLVGDAAKLPFPDSMFDVCYSFAAIHHIPGRELRAQFVREAARVLHPGGILILTAWDLWNRKRFGDIVLSTLKSILGLTPLEAGDLMLTFGQNKAPRYLHAFTKRELVTLLIENGFMVESISVIPHGNKEKNIVVIAKKDDG